MLGGTCGSLFLVWGGCFGCSSLCFFDLDGGFAPWYDVGHELWRQVGEVGW